MKTKRYIASCWRNRINPTRYGISMLLSETIDQCFSNDLINVQTQAKIWNESMPSDVCITVYDCMKQESILHREKCKLIVK